jgi:subtilisin family serine protease
MKRFLLRSIVRTFSALILFHAADIQAQSRVTYVPRQVIIKLDASTSPAEAAALRSSLGATVKQRYTSIGAELWEINAMTVGGAVDKFKTDPHVDYIEPNYILKANALFPNDPRLGEMWGLNNTGQNGGTPDADIDAPEAWSLGTGGTVVVGDIDTGMDMDHVDLAANLYTNPGEIAGNHLDDDNNGFVDDVHGWDFVNNDNNPDDDNGHGTHTAGTIAAVGNNGIGVSGVCWSARIMPLKFLDAGGSGSTGNAILAVQYATRMGARLTNNSWGGGGFSQGLRDAIADAGNHGILFVASAGNASSNNDLFPAYPASYDLPNIIAVASTDRLDQRSGFSNFGLVSVDLGAPGSDILSTVPNNGYALLSGTSMAGPHVSGAAALVWSVAPAMTGTEVRDLILSTVDPLPALAGKVATGGRLNLYGLLSSLDDVAPARVADLAVQSTGSTSARLTWTATGDDGSTGTATLYDVRYSKNGIYWSNFNAAPPAPGAPHPQSAGKLESFEITGLDYNTKYFFALVVEDENRNRSSLSNLPTGTTLGAPHLEYSPGSFNASLQTGGSDTQHLMIRNSALGTLDFAVGTAPSWIRVVPPSGRVNAGQSVQLDVVFDATHLIGGPYASNIVLTSNDVTQPAVPLPVTLQVTSAADISVAPVSVDFGTNYTGQCAADTVVVTNIGAATLLVGSLTTTSPFGTTATPFALNPGESRTLQVQFCPVAVGNASAMLAIASNDPDHPVLNVPLQGVAQDPPVISVSPSSLSADLFTGATQDQTLTVSNQGGSNLDFEISFEDLSPDALKTSVFGAARGDNDVRATGRPLSSAELKRIKTAIPHNVAVDKHGEIDRGKPSKPGPHRAMTLERVLGANLEEVFGSTQNQLTAGFRSRGNLFTCTTSTILVEQRFFMNPFAATEMWFLVYEGLAQVGSYDLVSASNVTPAGPGEGWYSSGEIDVPMEEGATTSSSRRSTRPPTISTSWT